MAGCALLTFSLWICYSDHNLSVSPFGVYQACLIRKHVRCSFSISLLLLIARCLDALGFIPASSFTGEMDRKRNSSRLKSFNGTVFLFMQRYPRRQDLPYQLLMYEPTGFY